MPGVHLKWSGISYTVGVKPTKDSPGPQDVFSVELVLFAVLIYS
eukprot:SAG31_NODE_2663_length_5278_cov_29.536011_1_plen_44_part_00